MEINEDELVPMDKSNVSPYLDSTRISQFKEGKIDEFNRVGNKQIRCGGTDTIQCVVSKSTGREDRVSGI